MLSRSVPLLLLLSLMVVATFASPPAVARMSFIDEPSRSFRRPDLQDGYWQQLQYRGEWQQFKRRFGRVYSGLEEEFQRMQIFIGNVRYITWHNELADKGIKTYRLGVNHFADMTHAEFLAKMNGARRPASNARRDGITYISPATNQSLPDTVDWRQNGAVTPVKDQGQCGSCWSFSTTGALEGQNFRKTGKLISLSEQQLVDCSGMYGPQGCNGGWMNDAFMYVKASGIELESSYPYRAKEGTCQYSKTKVAAICTGYVNITIGSEAKLQEAVANIGPVSVAIDASHSSFQLYKSGIYDEPECSSQELDHAVLVVGYGTEGGSDYWLVKNSWNVHWGEQGYIRMSRNKGNQCGIATAASYPTV